MFLVVSKALQPVDYPLELIPASDKTIEGFPSAEMMICVTATLMQAKPHIDTWNASGCSHHWSLTWLCMSPGTVRPELSLSQPESWRSE